MRLIEQGGFQLQVVSARLDDEHSHRSDLGRKPEWPGTKLVGLGAKARVDIANGPAIANRHDQAGGLEQRATHDPAVEFVDGQWSGDG